MITNNENPEVKLIDFGLSKQQSDLTKSVLLKTKLGTPQYMAPEVLYGKYTQKCDLWALGVLIYVCIQCDFPFKGDNQQEIFQAIDQGDFDFGYEWDDISTELRDFVMGLLTDEANRFTAAEALDHVWFQKYGSDSTSDIDQIKISASNIGKYYLEKKLVKYFKLYITCKREDKQKISEAFRQIDTNQDGTICKNELEQWYSKYGMEDQYKEYLNLLEEMDINGDGLLQYQEYQAATNSYNQIEDKFLEYVFRELDQNGDGVLSVDEIQKEVDYVGICEDWESLVGPDKGMDFETFKTIIKKGYFDM